MGRLTCYRLRDSIAGDQIDTLGEYLDPKKKATSSHSYSTDALEVEIHVLDLRPQQPKWASFFEFEGVTPPLSIPDRKAVSAILLVSVKEPDLRFAFTFGPGGRYLLREDAIEPRYGRKAALNILYPLSDGAPSTHGRMRSMDTKRVAGTVSRVRQQMSRDSDIFAFDIDEQRDLLGQVSGTPKDSGPWGSMISGSDALIFSSDAKLGEIGETCRAIEDVAKRQDYLSRFPWIDRIAKVEAKDELFAVFEAIEHDLQTAGTESDFDLSPPTILDPELAISFRLQGNGPSSSPVTSPLPRLPDFLTLHRTKGNAITIDLLKKRRVSAVDGDGRVVGEWSTWKCLTGSVQLNDKTYVLDEGDVYEVASSYLDEIKNDINNIETVELPASKHGQLEEDYLQDVVRASEGRILYLDRKQIQLPRTGSKIEACDLMVDSRQLIHVKRHFVAKGLSHLFNQGVVSGLALLEPANRQVVAQKMPEGASTHQKLVTQNFSPTEWTVIYGIIGKWGGRTTNDALPFFSRVTLRYAATSLRRLGYRVALSKIDILDPPRRPSIRTAT